PKGVQRGEARELAAAASPDQEQRPQAVPKRSPPGPQPLVAQEDARLLGLGEQLVPRPQKATVDGREGPFLDPTRHGALPLAPGTRLSFEAGSPPHRCDGAPAKP